MGASVAVKPFTVVVHVLGIAAAAMVLVWCIHFRGGLAFKATNKSLIFNIHPVLTLIGMIILGGEAIISFKAVPLSKEVKKLIHFTLHAFALILTIVGIYAAFKFHHEVKVPHLYSFHSWLGIGVVSLYGIQWIYGFVIFFYPDGSPKVRVQSLPWHVLFGLFVYVLAVVAAILGFVQRYTFLEGTGLDKYGREAFLMNFTAVVTVLFGVSIVLVAISPAKSSVVAPRIEFSGTQDINNIRI